ncbi:MAG: hypothetical protein HC841_00240 [Verrucomicrobiae bacterium]|nr:hypothetical protein [Verrucomicrobiae bacterium]
METTPYGYRVPETGDAAKGIGGWYEAIEFDIERLDQHNHDGTNSRQLSSSAIPTSAVVIPAADWVVDGVGYKQTLTTPAAVPEINDVSVRFYQTAPVAEVGKNAQLSFTRLTATTVDVFCSDNTAAFVMVLR